jgi:hypothetical protein
MSNKGVIITLAPVHAGLREESDQVLDRFEAEAGLVGERGSDGSRTYVLPNAASVEAAANSIVDLLTHAAPGWQNSVAMAL